MSNINDKLERIRKPRVHIKYDVETEGVEAEKELPFVVGVMGDFSGDSPGFPLKRLKDRTFTHIDRDNFDRVMGGIKPGVQFRVDNVLTEDQTELDVTLQFESMQDFLPVRIVEQVPALQKLKQVRDKLRDLLTKTDRSDELELLLEEVLQDRNSLNSLAKELGIDTTFSEKGGENE